jgi:SHS2 domain-containing protein
VWYTLQGILSKADELSLHAYAFRVAKLEERKDTLRLSGFLLYKNVGDKFSLMDIKAITPHELSVINKNGRFEITVVADV